MAEKLGEALLDLDTNDKGFKKGVDRAERDARGLGERLDDVGERAMRLGRNLAIGAAAGVAAFGVAVLRATRNISEMAAQAKMAGVNVEDFQRLKYAAEQNLVGVDALADGLKELNLRADEFIVTGSGSASEAFKRLGYNAAELTTKLKDPAALFTDIIGRLSQLDTAAQIRILDEIFGGSGGEQFMRLMAGGADGIKRLSDEFDRLGIVVKSDNVAAAEAFNSAFGRVGTVFDGLVTQMAVELIPTLTRFANWLADPSVVSNAQGMAQGVVGVFNMIADAVQVTANKVSEFGKLMEWMSTHDWSSGQVDPDKMAARGRAALASVGGQLTRGETTAPDSSFLESIFGAGSTGKPTTPSIPGLSGSGFTSGLGTQEVDKAKALIASLRGELDTLREMDPVQQRLISMREQLAKATDIQRAEVENLISTIHAEATAWENAQAAGQFFGDQMLNGIEAIRTGSKSLIQVVDDLVGSLAQAVLQSMLLGQGPLSGLFGTQSAGGGLGGIVGSLFSGFFADGGLIPNGSFGIVGEAGPEIAVGGARGTQILPNSTFADMAGGGARGDTYISVDGSGLTQAEMTQAIADALERYDRHQLPQRVTDIQNDPLARG